MAVRLSQVALVASVALFLLLVVVNNLTDYGSNFAFVAHVLSMDTTFPANQESWRALRSPAAHHAFYAMIIAWELVAGLLCAAGAMRLWRARTRPAAEFHRAKTVAIAGLTVGLLLWFVAFLTIGGEWFLMWQSRTWNGQESAFRMFVCFGVILLFLVLPEREAR